MNKKTGVGEINEVGDYCFRMTDIGEVEARHFICMIPGGDIISVPVHLATEVPKRPTSWVWNGNEEKPSLTPSLLVQGVNAWHGYVTNGELCTC